MDPTAASCRRLAVPHGQIRDIAFSPDGTRLAAASLDKMVWLWDLATEEVRTLRGHTGQVGTAPCGSGWTSSPRTRTRCAPG
ncbi:WD40 repeat domain-containing protein [Archangium lansingense]|uniref:WD40 repeat protein n=1 Tax=Archangium lansingense TaxID=2995310 RepID=A0ABT4A7G0_9BACT|nr:hypothetical protein [Archangium lansinium]MCY1077597.1 hypothetical protein [Archangium lansinium]